MGGGDSKKTSFKFQKLSTSILLVYYNARSMRLYIWCFCLRRQNLLIDVEVYGYSFQWTGKLHLLIDVEVGIPFNGLASYFP